VSSQTGSHAKAILFQYAVIFKIKGPDTGKFFEMIEQLFFE
jgi:hypothetical protein